MSEHPPPGILADALRLPAQERLALAAELIDSVEGTDDPEWGQAWLAELDRRAQEVSRDPSKLEDWALVRARILSELQSR
jgi:putative addiction module component (TIGR02574 family)